MSITDEAIKRFQRKALLFYETNGRILPWRQTTDPYKILLSEFMLQQTQVSRVITYYSKCIDQWPTIFDLAASSRRDVLHAWIGLGYNTRAVNLHRTAQIISELYRGDVLESMKHYEELPGIGVYTSQAVQIFASNKDMVTVDTNIRRILIHEFHLPEDTPAKELWCLAERCLPQGRSRDWHNALMDYGALFLTSRKTGIAPLTQQSTFKGSDRQIRGQILRLLLQQKLSALKIQRQLRTDPKRLTKILKKMVDEGLIIQENNSYQICEGFEQISDI